MIKKILLGALVLLIPAFTLAAPTTIFQRSLIPETTDMFDLGSSTLSKEWNTVFTKSITVSGLGGSGTRCVQVDTNGLLAKASAACGSGSGGGGGTGGTWATTTSSVPNVFLNYPLNTTDVVMIGDVSATSSASWWYNPNITQEFVKGKVGIGTTSPSQALSVQGNGLISGNLTLGTLTATSSASIPALSNLTSNGFVKTSGGIGTLSIDTTTYLSAVTADSPLSGSGTSGSHLTLSTAGTWSGLAGTATALAADGANCSAGSYPLGVDASGAVQNCTVAAVGTVTSVSGSGVITSTGGVTPIIAYTGLATSTALTGGRLLYSDGKSAVTDVATTTLSAGSGLSFAGTAGALVGGQNLTISVNPSFTPNTNYNSTSTPIGFLNGFFSTASSTVNSTLTLTPLATAAGSFLAVDANGKIIATSTLSISNTSGYKDPVNYATTAALPANTYGANVLTEVGTGALSVDGASPSVGQRILVKNESTQTNNGVYDVTATGSGIAAYVLTRSSDYNTSSKIYPGVANYVISGTTNGDTSWALTTAAPVTLDTSNLTYVETANGNIQIPVTVAQGGTGLQTLTSSQLLYGNGTANLSSVATTTASCSGSVSCTAFSIIGSSPITITGSGTGGTGLSTTSPISAGNLLVYSATGAGSAFGVATSSETCSTGVTCAAHVVLTGGGAITLSALGSAGVLGAQTATTPTVQATSTLYGNGTAGQVLGWTNGSLGFIATTSTFATLTVGQATTTGTQAIPFSTTASTPVAGTIGIDTTSGQLRYSDVTGTTRVLSPLRDMGFAYATTTWGANATTTIRIGPAPANITVSGAYCETNTGTVGVSVTDATPNRLDYIRTASTTINKFNYTTNNNSFTAGESIRVDLGTPASSPTSVSCRLLYTYDAD